MDVCLYQASYRNSKPNLHRTKQDTKECSKACEEIHLVDFPYVASFFDVDEARKSR